jgi:hypothetical protein
LTHTDSNNHKAHEPSFLLVRDDAVLPPDLSTEDRSSFLPGWCAVKNFDNLVLRRRIRETNWSFLHIRGSRETGMMMGRGRQKILQKAVTQILAEFRGRRFNSMEVSVVASNSFLGMNFLKISVHLRHFQYNVPVPNRA